MAVVKDPEAGLEFLIVALDKTADIGAECLTGVTFGGIGQRTGVPPTPSELDMSPRS